MKSPGLILFNTTLINFSARRIYVGGILIYSTGMCLMALTKHKVGVVLFSWTAGIMYSTLFTMPYLLVAHYHSKGVVSDNLFIEFYDYLNI